MRIFYGNVSGLTEEVRRDGMAFLTAERRQRVESCVREEDRRRCFGAGLLLWYGLYVCGIPLDEVTVQRGRDGKPYLMGYPDFQYNLSHAGDYVAVVFDEKAVGIDIEQDSRCREQIAKRFWMPEEYAYLMEAEEQAEREERFGRIWTRKESYIKATGAGMRQGLDTFCVLKEQEADWHFRTYRIEEGYQISVCSREIVTAEQPVRLDLKKICNIP